MNPLDDHTIWIGLHDAPILRSLLYRVGDGMGFLLVGAVDRWLLLTWNALSCRLDFPLYKLAKSNKLLHVLMNRANVTYYR